MYWRRRYAAAPSCTGARDLAHALGPRGLLEDPPGQVEPDGDPEERAQEREQDGVVLEEVGHGCNETGRCAGPACAFPPARPETAGPIFITPDDQAAQAADGEPGRLPRAAPASSADRYCTGQPGFGSSMRRRFASGRM